jgi:hypothetical protein
MYPSLQYSKMELLTSNRIPRISIKLQFIFKHLQENEDVALTFATATMLIMQT